VVQGIVRYEDWAKKAGRSAGHGNVAGDAGGVNGGRKSKKPMPARTVGRDREGRHECLRVLRER